MTREEAVEILQGAIKKPNTKDGYLGQAIDMAIKALEQETVSKEDYDHEYFLRKEFELKIDELQRQLEEQAVKAESILDKIRAEILEEKECAYADFERYKVEYLGQDPEDVLDSLPQDDFRYGMERAIEIIDKFMVETEGNNVIH